MNDSTNIDATPQRPEGTRQISGPFVQANIKELIETLTSESTWEDSDRNAITIYKSPVLVNTLVGLKEGAGLEQQTVKGLLSVQVLKGELSFITADQKTDLGKKDIAWIEPGLPFTIQAREESVFILSISQVREGD